MDQGVETLGLRISRSEVSRVCALLDEQVEPFRQRPLAGDYPYLCLNAKVEKVQRRRPGGRQGGLIACLVRSAILGPSAESGATDRRPRPTWPPRR